MERFTWAGQDAFVPFGPCLVPLVLRDARVDLVAPGENPTFHIPDVLKSGLAEDSTGLSAAHAALAVNDDIGVRVELGEALPDLAERDQARGGDVADLVLVRLANVDQYEVVAAVELGLYLFYVDLTLAHLGLLRRRLLRHAAELMIIDQFRDGAMVAADGALGILAELQLAELHAEGVVEHEASDEGLADAEDQLDGLGRLDEADRAGEDAENAAFGAARNEARGWRLGIEATVAGAALIGEDGRLTLEAENGAVDVGLAKQDAGVIHQVASGEVVGAVDADVLVLEDVERVLAGEGD